MYKGPYSYSRIERYLKCPLSFKLAYIDKVPMPETPSLRVGSAFHSIAEDFLKKFHSDGFISPDEQRKAVLSLLEEKEAEMSETEVLDLRTMVDGWFSSFVPESDVEEPEIEMSTAVNREFSPVEWMDPDVFSRLKIDYLYFRNGRKLVVITDWKTDRYLPPQSVIEKSLQLKLYGFFTYILFPEVKDVVIRLFYVKYGVPRTKELDVEEALDVRDRLFSIIDKIEKDQKFSARVGSHCSYCPFTGVCPFFRRAAEGSGSVVVNTPKEALELASQLRLLEERQKQIREALKAWVEKNGRVVVGDTALDFWPEERLSFDPPKVAEILMDSGVPREEVWKVMSVTKTSLNKLKKEHKETVEKILEAAPKNFTTKFKFGRIEEAEKEEGKNE